jgi:hypothetical protein
MSEYILKNFPDRKDLISWYKQQKPAGIPEINAHLHTPYSFSAFNSMEQIFTMATAEKISVLGINDFFVADGYSAFYKHSLQSRIFPLFNIEFIGLLVKQQKNNIRVNDPNNPGRTYFCGKGLDYPHELELQYDCLLRNIRYESQLQVKEMIEKTNSILHTLSPKISLKYSEIKRLYAKELVRERHIARAVRTAVFDKLTSSNERAEFLKKLFNGKEVKADLNNEAALENVIRANLLKAGGSAFVPEDPATFLPLPEIIEIILDAGGIPCYPVLLDDASGKFTEYESDRQSLLKELEDMNVFCIELIPGRNDLTILKEFVQFFHDHKFVITFGTEHNTPELAPLLVTARGNQSLDPYLKTISWEGASVIAAHQYLHATGEEGYIKLDGKANRDKLDDFIELGKAVIGKFIALEKIL